jgi:hypothetical protein
MIFFPNGPWLGAAGQVAGRLQVGHDGLDAALGQPDRGGDVADPGFGVSSDLHQDVPVAGQQGPGAAALARVTDIN